MVMKIVLYILEIMYLALQSQILNLNIQRLSKMPMDARQKSHLALVTMLPMQRSKGIYL